MRPYAKGKAIALIIKTSTHLVLIGTSAKGKGNVYDINTCLKIMILTKMFWSESAKGSEDFDYDHVHCTVTMQNSFKGTNLASAIIRPPIPPNPTPSPFPLSAGPPHWLPRHHLSLFVTQKWNLLSTWTITMMMKSQIYCIYVYTSKRRKIIYVCSMRSKILMPMTLKKKVMREFRYNQNNQAFKIVNK